MQPVVHVSNLDSVKHEVRRVGRRAILAAQVEHTFRLVRH
jgi:hypothetical protein